MYKRTKIFDLNYYKFIESWAWILHRLAGLALVFYITLHIWVINVLTKGPDKFKGNKLKIEPLPGFSIMKIKVLEDSI